MSGVLRIQINVPLGTPWPEIQEMVFRQAWEKAGTQLRAAFALGITPETISRFLKKREKLARSEQNQGSPAATGAVGDSCVPSPGGQDVGAVHEPPQGNS
jgi:hypothetical protein